MQISCHCKNVVIEVQKPASVTQCNCSICSRYMSLWGYFQPGDAQIEIGAHGTDSYSWGDNELDFIRCSHCGCITHYITKPDQPDAKVAINFGLARNEIGDLPVRYFDGAKQL